MWEIALMQARQILSRSGAAWFGLIVATLLAVPAVQADRIKDLVSIGGVRDNQLVGYGLVVGLDGTGDQTTQAPFTIQSLKSMLNRLGVTVPANVNPQLKNVAAAAIHATLPPFVKPGQTIDVTVSSIGNAKSLRGGTLLITPLQGIDGQVYAIAQGNLLVGGLSVDAQGGTSVTVNIPSAGRIPNGATVERAVATPFGTAGTLTLNLNTPDFTTVRRVVAAVEREVGAGIATPMDGASLSLRMPRDPLQHVGFISIIENLQVEPAEAPARIVVNSRTGTVVIGRHVRVQAAAVSHGNLSVTVTNEQQVSQPEALSPQAQTAIVNQGAIDIEEERNPMFLFKPGIALGDIVRAVNNVGASPGDLVAILQALKAAGALRAQLIVI
jgi:flagellar P-ring protein FlgI